MHSDNPVVELPIAVETAMFRLSDEQVYVPISAKLSSTALDWAQKHGRRQAEFDFAAEVRAAPSGQIVAQLRDTINVQLDQQRFEQVHQIESGVSGRRRAFARLLSPEIRRARKRIRKDRHLRAEFRPRRSGRRSGSRSAPCCFRASLCRWKNRPRCRPKTQGLRAKLATSPLEMEGQRIVPSVTRFFTQQQTLYVFFQAYYPEKSDAFDPDTLCAPA